MGKNFVGLNVVCNNSVIYQDLEAFCLDRNAINFKTRYFVGIIFVTILVTIAAI